MQKLFRWASKWWPGLIPLAVMWGFAAWNNTLPVEADLSASVTMRYYLHQPAGVIAREVPKESEWWLGVLDVHYRLGGSPVETAPSGVEA